MALKDLTTLAINQAIAEYRQLGRPAFLKKYNFRKARDYLLLKDGRSYDSKAIAGAAHGYLPSQSPLKWNEFSGGDATVRKVLEDLGFTVIDPGEEKLPAPGEVLSNSELSRRFTVGNMGGMRRSKKRDLLVLISDPFKGLYQDRWEGNVLHYTGMGKLGHQSLEHAQNRTLIQSPKSGIAVHLFEALDPQKYTYVGQVDLARNPYQEDQPDDAGTLRRVWMFPIKLKNSAIRPIPTTRQAREIEENQESLARKHPLTELLRRAKKAKPRPAARTAQTTSYARDPNIAAAVKELAKGICDLCYSPAPFRNPKGEPHLESHHIVWLAKGGDDILENAVALCPNCHRKMHVLNRAADRKKLTYRVATRG